MIDFTLTLCVHAFVSYFLSVSALILLSVYSIYNVPAYIFISVVVHQLFTNSGAVQLCYLNKIKDGLVVLGYERVLSLRYYSSDAPKT